MQQKGLKYILIAGVVFTWGMIIYKIISAQDVENNNQTIPDLIVMTTPVVYDSFALHSDYPDPFLPDSAFEIPDTLVNQPAQNIPVQQTESLKPELSQIQYYGMIRNPTKRIKVGIIKFNGRELLIREKEKLENLIFKKIAADMLVIMLDGKEFSIAKSGTP